MLGYFRFVLAFGVLLAHASLLPPTFSRTMVSAFFVISGYLMGLSLSANYGRNPGPFYWNRILRVYPLHILVSAGILILYLNDGADQLELGWLYNHEAEPSNGELARSFLLVRDDAGTLNPPAWTLFYEMAFYLAAPLLVLARGALWPFAMGATIIALLAMGEGGLLLEPFGVEGSDAAVAWSASFLFLLGLGVYFLRRILGGDVLRRFAFPVEIGALGILAVLVISQFDFLNAEEFRRFHEPNQRLWNVLALLATVALLFAWTRDRGPSKRAADLTYPLYLIHWPVLYLLLGEQAQMRDLQESLVERVDGAVGAFTSYEPAAGLIVAAVLTTVVTLAFAQAWLWIEKPTLQRLRSPHRTKKAASRTAVDQPETAGAPAPLEPEPGEVVTPVPPAGDPRVTSVQA